MSRKSRQKAGMSRGRAGRASRRARDPGAERGLGFTRKTAVYGGAGLIFAAAGFLFLARGSINLAPVLLLVGFLLFFPLALVK